MTYVYAISDERHLTLIKLRCGICHQPSAKGPSSSRRRNRSAPFDNAEAILDHIRAQLIHRSVEDAGAWRPRRNLALALARVFAGELRNANGKYDQAAGDRYHSLRARIGHTPGASLVAAVQARTVAADNEEIAELAELFSRETYGDEVRARPFREEGLAAIGALAQDWGDRMLASGNAKRWQTASIATLVSHAPSATLLPIVKRLLDDNLRRYRAFREEAKANGWRQGEAVNEARTPHTHEYQRAFIAIKAPETTALMGEYLADEHFGELAATVLAVQWSEAESKDDKKLCSGVDFTRVETRRAARAANSSESSAEADMIFGVIDALIADGATDEQKKLAVALGIVGARLPHGQRDVTIQKLIALAPRQARANLLLSLVLSGEDIDIKLVVDGIAETFEAAKKETWILTQSDAYQLRAWLRLLPFSTPVSEVPAVVRGMPDAQRNPHLLEEMVGGLGNLPSDGTEAVLFKLAEDDPRFYLDHQWRATVLRLGTVSSARRLVDLTANGTLSGKFTDDGHWRRELGGLISEFPDVRAGVVTLLVDGRRCLQRVFPSSRSGHCSPCPHSFAAKLAKCLTADQVTLNVEGVVDGGVC